MSPTVGHAGMQRCQAVPEQRTPGVIEKTSLFIKSVIDYTARPARREPKQECLTSTSEFYARTSIRHNMVRPAITRYTRHLCAFSALCYCVIAFDV